MKLLRRRVGRCDGGSVESLVADRHTRQSFKSVTADQRDVDPSECGDAMEGDQVSVRKASGHLSGLVSKHRAVDAMTSPLRSMQRQELLVAPTCRSFDKHHSRTTTSQLVLTRTAACDHLLQLHYRYNGRRTGARLS